MEEKEEKKQEPEKKMGKPKILQDIKSNQPFVNLTRLGKMELKEKKPEEIQKEAKSKGRPKKNDKENQPNTDEEIAKKLQEYELNIGKRMAKRKRSYKEVPENIDEKEAEEEGKRKTEKSKLIKLRKQMKENKKDQHIQTEDFILPDISLQEMSGITGEMRPEVSGDPDNKTEMIPEESGTSCNAGEQDAMTKVSKDGDGI